jgi:hypothetical protein
MANASDMDIEDRIKQRLPQADEVQERLQELDQRVRKLCREHPVAMLVGTLAVGFVVGRIVTRL